MSVEIRNALIEKLDQRVADKILEPNNAKLLKKLIQNADNDDAAMMIETLGTIYKKTGLYFDPRLEEIKTDVIRYFKKNNELSFHSDNTKPTHKLIIGDNYEILQNLLIQYKSSIDVIYIDPPYGKDSMGEFAKTNYKNSITRDNLLSMLKPRLEIARQLLSEGGVIFCSIDDRNHAYVKCLFDDVFGEKAFVGTYLWKKTDTPPSLSTKIRKKYEYVLCYGKKLSKSYKFTQGNTDGGDIPLLNSGNPLKEICFPKGSVHFNIADGTYEANEDQKIQLIDSVIVKNGLNKNAFKAKGRWKWKQETLNEEVAKGTYFLVKSEKFSIRFLRNSDEKTAKIPQNNIDSELGVGTNEDGSNELKKIMNSEVFDNPKPYSLIEFLIQMTNKDDDIKVLDFFAGSGTTGHAILNMNEDGGNRQFILCQLNEKLDEALNESTNKATLENQIALCEKYKRPHELSEITAERLRRIMTGKCYDRTKDFPWINENTPYGGNLDVYEIAAVFNSEATKGKTPFDVIDETLYGQQKFKTLKEKIQWVCENFPNTQKILKNK